MNPTRFGKVKVCLRAAIVAIAVLPRTAESATISLSTVLAGGTQVASGANGPVSAATQVVTPGGYEARARTGVSNQVLTGGVTAATNGDSQHARATAHVESVWDCPVGNCLTLLPTPNMFLSVSFDGIVDPLMLTNPADETFDTSSMDVFFRYVFPGGEFNFTACYEMGTPFDRGESGCASFFEVTLDRPGQNTQYLTNLLQFGPNNSVSFNYTLPWLVQNNTWIDSYDIGVNVSSIDSTVPHVLNFFNTFGVQQTSLNPNAVFTTGSGLSTAPAAAAEVPEPASMVLFGSGALMTALRRRRDRQKRG